MDLSERLAISYYKEIADINESHKVYLVQHQETKKIYVKKVLDGVIKYISFNIRKPKRSMLRKFLMYLISIFTEG